MLKSLLGLLPAALLLCTLLGHTRAAQDKAVDEEKLIGWRGETYTADEQHKPWVETIAWHPRVFVHHNLVSPEEARVLRSLSAPTMRQSMVIGKNGSGVLDGIRTSYGTFLRRLSHPMVTAVSRRVAEWVGIPPIHQEDIQVLRYSVGQKYGPHWDSLIDDSPRVCTVLLYLSDVEEGGETAFPQGSEWVSPERQAASGNVSECAAGHVAFHPKLGDAVLFHSLQPDGTHDPSAMHTGCPVVKGVKWTATVWTHSMPFHAKDYAPPDAKDTPLDPGLCENGSPQCEGWASTGECERNPTFMVGAEGGVGKCRRACRACEVCHKPRSEDKECYEYNRASAGFLVFDEKEVLEA